MSLTFNKIQDDLRVFHAKHFPSAPTPVDFLHGVEAEATEECLDEADDDLGYYPDGTKRTLTDDQIAMFRHSEVRAILRERKRKVEDGEVSDDGARLGSGQLEPGVPGSFVLNPLESSNTTPSGQPDTIGCEVPEQIPSGQVEKPNIQRWATSSTRTKTRNKRNRNKYRAKQKVLRLQKEQEGTNHYDQDDDESDEWDPWHQANGPDAQKQDDLDLDY